MMSGALLRGLRRPAGERGLRGLDRPPGVLAGRARHRGDDGAVSRIDDIEARAVGRGHPLAPEEQVCAQEIRVAEPLQKARGNGGDRHDDRFADRAGIRNANIPVIRR